MRGLTAAFAMLGMASSAMAAPPPVVVAAGPPPCITRAQVSDITLFAVPVILDALAAKCRPSLPPTAYLLTAGHALSERLAASSAQHWEGAMSFVKSFGDQKPPVDLSADTARGMIRDVLVGQAMKTTTPSQCVKINEAAELLAPLPPENMGRLFAVLMELADESKKMGGLTICR